MLFISHKLIVSSSEPVSLNPIAYDSVRPPNPLLWIVGNEDKPETVYPLTPIDIGDVDLENPDSLPHEYFPTGLIIVPVVPNPTIEVWSDMLQVIIPVIVSTAWIV